MCHITPKELTNLIFSLRELYSAAQLGQLIGVSSKTIYNWESGQFFPHKTHLRRVIQLARQSKIVSLPAPAQAPSRNPIAANG